LVYNVKVCAHNMYERYHVHWMNTYPDYEQTIEHLPSYLRSLDISRTDKVLLEGDNSINIFLYLMDQKGYTNFERGPFRKSYKMKYLKKLGVEYLIVMDTVELKKAWLKPYLKDKIGQYQNVPIYKLDSVK